MAAGKEVTVSFGDEDRPGYFAAINENLELAEVGWLKFPKLMHIGWAAQWLQYETELRMNLSLPALVVPIFEEKVRKITCTFNRIATRHDPYVVDADQSAFSNSYCI